MPLIHDREEEENEEAQLSGQVSLRKVSTEWL